MKSALAVLVIALALPVYAQTNLEEAPGTPDLPPAPASPSTSDLESAVDELSREQNTPAKSKPQHEKPASPVKLAPPAKHAKPVAHAAKSVTKSKKSEKKKPQKAKAAKKAAHPKVKPKKKKP